MSRSIMRTQALALLGVLLVASSAAQALAVSALLRTAPTLAALQDEGDEEEADQEQADEAASADEAQSEDGADAEEALSDEEEPAEEEPAEEEESVDEAEPADESGPADATEPAEAAAEEPVASTPAPEPATSQPAADVERWSVTIQSTMNLINQELTIEKSADGAVVARIEGDGVTGQRVPLEIAGNKLSWSWDVTNPIPMQITCESTTQGDRMTGNCKVGMFGYAPMFGSRK